MSEMAPDNISLKNTFQIREVASLLGLSVDSIRFYEKRGLITPQRDKENDYRYYSGNDLIQLYILKIWQKYGLSISEISNLYGKASIDEILNIIDQKEAMYRRKIQDSEYAILKMSLLKENIWRAKHSLGVHYIVPFQKRIGLFFLYDGKIDKSIISSDFYKAVSSDPHMFDTVSIVPQEYAYSEESEKHFMHGFWIDANWADFLGISSIPHAKIFDTCTCVHTIQVGGTIAPQKVIDYSVLKQSYEWIGDHGFKMCGDVMCSTIGTLQAEGLHYFDIWIPVS